MERDFILDDESTKEYKHKQKLASLNIVESANSNEEASKFLMMLGLKEDSERKPWKRDPKRAKKAGKK